MAKPLPPFIDHSAAALALLNSGRHFSARTGSFLGQCAVDPTALAPEQSDWLARLLDWAGLPPVGEVVHG